MTFYLPIAGTDANDGEDLTARDWIHHESAISMFLLDRGLQQLSPGRPFVWTTRLDGIEVWRRWLKWLRLRGTDQVDWQTAGLNLWSYLDPPWPWPPKLGEAPVPHEWRNLITHSHGLQPALFACAAGLKIRRLLSIAGPVRADMMETAARARPNIEKWTHVCSDSSDRWQWLGEIGDGAFGIVREHPLADENICIPKVGHSGLIYDEKAFHFWTDAGLIPFLVNP